LDRLALFRLIVDANASCGGWCSKKQRCRQEYGEPLNPAAFLLQLAHWLAPPAKHTNLEFFAKG